MSNATAIACAGLTPRQSEIYDFIKNQIMVKGIPPTVREIGDQFDIKSPNGVMCHLKALEKKKLITRQANLSRSITLAGKLKRETAVACRGSFDPKGSKIKEESNDCDFVTIIGTGENFAYVVSAESESPKDGIHKGDILVCKPLQFYRDDSLVVVTINKKSFLKRYSETPEDELKFESMNGPSKPMIISKDEDVRIEGMVVGLVRKIS